MANQTCGDCLFRGESYVWNKGDLCNKTNQRVDDENPACPYFIPDTHECCYDCDGRKDVGFDGFYCTILKKRIKNPHCWVCSQFRD